MTPEQFNALESWISDMIHNNSTMRESYLKARALLVVEPAKEIEGTGCDHSRGFHITHIDGKKNWSCCGEKIT